MHVTICPPVFAASARPPRASSPAFATPCAGGSRTQRRWARPGSGFPTMRVAGATETGSRCQGQTRTARGHTHRRHGRNGSRLCSIMRGTQRRRRAGGQGLLRGQARCRAERRGGRSRRSARVDGPRRSISVSCRCGGRSLRGSARRVGCITRACRPCIGRQPHMTSTPPRACRLRAKRWKYLIKGISLLCAGPQRRHGWRFARRPHLPSAPAPAPLQRSGAQRARGMVPATPPRATETRGPGGR